jgi:hypothetical protein
MTMSSSRWPTAIQMWLSRSSAIGGNSLVMSGDMYIFLYIYVLCYIFVYIYLRLNLGPGPNPGGLCPTLTVQSLSPTPRSDYFVCAKTSFLYRQNKTDRWPGDAARGRRDRWHTRFRWLRLAVGFQRGLLDAVGGGPFWGGRRFRWFWSHPGETENTVVFCSRLNSVMNC